MNAPTLAVTLVTLAQADLNVPWKVTAGWLLGLIGFLGVVFLVFGIVIQCKKLWGRTPPVHEQFEDFDADLDEREKSIRLAIRDGDAETARAVKELRQEVSEKLDALSDERAERNGVLDRKFDHLIEKMEENKGEILVVSERRAVDLHNRINEIGEAVARVDERTKNL